MAVTDDSEEKALSTEVAILQRKLDASKATLWFKTYAQYTASKDIQASFLKLCIFIVDEEAVRYPQVQRYLQRAAEEAKEQLIRRAIELAENDRK